MKNISKMVAGALALTLAATSVTASAQFGGLGRMAKGLVGGGSVSAADGEAFLYNAARSTKNIMISVRLLSQVLEDRNSLAGQKAYIDEVQNTPDVKELSAHRATFSSDLAVLNQREDLTADLSAAYESGNEEQRKVIALAVGNLAIGILRNTELVGQAPALVEGIGANPQLVTRLGQFKLAAELLGMQAKGLGGVAGSLPKLLRAVKVEMPEDAETTEPQPIAL